MPKILIIDQTRYLVIKLPKLVSPCSNCIRHPCNPNIRDKCKSRKDYINLLGPGFQTDNFEWDDYPIQLPGR